MRDHLQPARVQAQCPGSQFGDRSPVRNYGRCQLCGRPVRLVDGRPEDHPPFPWPLTAARAA